MSAASDEPRVMAKARNEPVPVDVYIQFVRSLFDNVHMVLVGACCHTVIALMAYWKTGHMVYAVFGGVLLAIGLWRYIGMLHCLKVGGITTAEAAAQWELDYILKGSIQGLALGSFCFVSIYLVPDSFAEIGAISVTLASIVTVAGRNYGSPVMVTIFSLTFVAPIAMALILRGDPPNVVLGLLIVPFFFIVRATATNIRSVLFSAVIGHKQAGQLAQRFDRALNTMSHGLVMLDSEGRVVVANAEANEAFSAKSPDALLGRSLKALVMRSVASGMLSAKDGRYLEAQLTRALREGRGRKILVRLTNGRHQEFSVSEGAGGLGVITFEDVSLRIEAEEKIRTMARYDSLTGLANRAYFHEIVGEMLSAGDQDRSCALVVFDLDDFKSVNDTLGHPIGDGLIFAVAEKLQAHATERIKVSRFGGDEFMVFVDRVEGEADLSVMLDDIMKSLQGEVDVAGHAIRIQVSAGAVLSRVKDSDVDTMIVKADLALYKAKELGKNGWRLFEAAMDAAFRNRQLLKADLRNAIETKGLRVVYQPIVSIETMRISSCEALCRWDHPELGPISPGIFIPLAEEMGIISEISSFMLMAATRECIRWPDQTSVSVNLSAKDFRNRDVVEKVRTALVESGLAAHRLEIEVTETALLDDKSLTRELIEELKALGVRIALDDFGTGYSSLSYLHKLPLDKIKIDRSFLIDVTQSRRSLELLTGIVNLSRPLGLSVTVEGVETFEQLKILTLKVKPDFVQGFLFGSALTASGIETMSTTVWPFASKLKSAKRATQR
jgi:diguanylate cyclase (GGDEF)-like protein